MGIVVFLNYSGQIVYYYLKFYQTVVLLSVINFSL